MSAITAQKLDTFSNLTKLQLSQAEFEMLRNLVYDLTGINLAGNKKTMLESRLIRRIKALGLPDFASYCKLVLNMKASDAEARAFINAVTTNLTQFFRENHHFEYIANDLIPSALKTSAQGNGKPFLRIWHAGCSTGQEPYSMAMTLQDALGSLFKSWDIKILASDIDTNVLQTAKDGIYRSDELASVSIERKNRYFTPNRYGDQPSYQISDSCKKLITFRHMNLLEEPWPLKPTTMFDIIFCRNVVIYFDMATQKRLFERFINRLVPGGYIFIGHSESLYRICSNVDLVATTIYQKPMS